MVKIILCHLDETGFLSDCPSLMLRIAIRCIEHSQATLERGVCELAHSFFYLKCSNEVNVLEGCCKGNLKEYQKKTLIDYD